MSFPLWLPPGSQGVAGADAERVIRRGRLSPRADLHVDSGRFRFASTLVLDEQLFDDASQKADACLALPCPDEDTATYLVEDRGRALRRGWIDNVSLECADGGGLSVQPGHTHSSDRIGRSDIDRVSDIDRCQSCGERFDSAGHP